MFYVKFFAVNKLLKITVVRMIVSEVLPRSIIIMRNVIVDVIRALIVVSGCIITTSCIEIAFATKRGAVLAFDAIS